MVPVDNIYIRPAQKSDLDQLAHLREALWPKSSAEEHAQELRLIVGGKAASLLTMPLSIFVAEKSDWDVSRFSGSWFTFACGGLQPITSSGLHRGLVCCRGSPPSRSRPDAARQGGGVGAQSQVRRNGFRCPCLQ